MTDKVFYEDMLPEEFQERLADRPIGYLPLGTLEWHGPHNALGADSIQAQGIFARAAKRFGGIVFPPLWLGTDRDKTPAASPPYLHVDVTGEIPDHKYRLGDCFWVPQLTFLMIIEAALAMTVRAGFRCIVADGHGPSRRSFALCADTWERQFGITLVSVTRDLNDHWRCQMDHAGRNETSIMMAVAPELVDLSKLSPNRSVWPHQVFGEDPRDATPEYGEECIEASVKALGEHLDKVIPRSPMHAR